MKNMKRMKNTVIRGFSNSFMFFMIFMVNIGSGFFTSFLVAVEKPDLVQESEVWLNILWRLNGTRHDSRPG